MRRLIYHPKRKCWCGEKLAHVEDPQTPYENYWECSAFIQERHMLGVDHIIRPMLYLETAYAKKA